MGKGLVEEKSEVEKAPKQWGCIKCTGSGEGGVLRMDL